MWRLPCPSPVRYESGWRWQAGSSNWGHHSVNRFNLVDGRTWAAWLQSPPDRASIVAYRVHASGRMRVLTAYLLSASIFTPIMGRVGDMIGKERMFLAALAALAAGSQLAAVASSIGS